MSHSIHDHYDVYDAWEDDAPTAAEAERDAPTEAEVARAIERQGPPPVTREDFMPPYTPDPF